jgi:hypothetical protein
VTSKEFVRRIHIAVYERAVSGTKATLEKVPGRRPLPQLLSLSSWFNQLTPTDQQQVEAAIKLAVRNAVFGVLAVLDGDRSIRQSDEELGTLRLLYDDSSHSVLINDPNGDVLHDLFAEHVPLR